MVCKNCETKSVIKLTNTNKSLCKNCFIRYFERKVKNTISKYKMVDKGDHIGVAVSGGKDSLTTLYLLHEIFSNRKDIKITALAIDEGIKGYRDEALEHLKKFCKGLKVELKIYSFKKEFGKTLDQILKKEKHPCSICGVLRRFLLNSKARKLKFTKLATGHNLDDESQSVIMNQFRRNVKTSARLGPVTGILKDKKLIRRIKPLYFLTEKEVRAYAYLKGFMDKFNECPYHYDSYRGAIRDMLNDFEDKHPGTKHNVISSFLEVLPLLKKEYKNLGDLMYCKKCKEPCSSEVCRVCEMLKRLK